MDIMEDESGQIVPTERIEIALIGSVVFIVTVAMLLKLDVNTLLTIIISGFIGIITGVKLNSIGPDTTSTDDTHTSSDELIEEDSP